LDNPDDVREGPSNNNNNLDAGVAPAGHEDLPLGHWPLSQPSSHASRRVDDDTRQQLHDRIEQLEQDLISLRSSCAATSVSRSWSNFYQSSKQSCLPTCHNDAFKRACSVRSRHDLTPLLAPSIMAVPTVTCPAVAPMAPPSQLHLRPQLLMPYKGLSLKEHWIYFRQLETQFQLFPGDFATDEIRILYTMQALQGEPAKAWNRYDIAHGIERVTWEFFKKFLLNLVKDPESRALSIAKDYALARQRPNQSVHDFNAYLEQLECHQELYTVTQQINNLILRLCKSLREDLIKVQSLPDMRDGVLALAQRLEGATDSRHRHTDRPTPTGHMSSRML